MDLSKLSRPEPVALRMVRVRNDPESHAPTEVEGLDLPDLPIFDGGEEVSVEEREVEFPAEFEDHHGFPPYDERKSISQTIEQVIKDSYALPVPVPAPRGQEDRTARHPCIVSPCSWYLDVPEVETASVSALLGAGPGLAAVEQAREVEQLLTEHLHTHSVLDWARALKAAQDERDAARSSPGVITSGYAPPADTIVPGPVRRDSAREAAVRAMDARLGRPTSTLTPTAAEREIYDNQLRAARDAKRARTVSPYDLTPKWSQDQEGGVVGIKR